MRLLCTFALIAYASHAGAEPTEDCESIASRALAGHPRLRAARMRVEASTSRAASESALPPPHASIEVWDFPIGDPSRADREGMYMFGLGQEFPPGNDQRARAETESTKANQGALRETARAVWSEVALACTQWSTAEAVREQLGAHQAILEKMRDAMLPRFRTGDESLGALARADVELAVADRHIAEADEEALSARHTLEALVADMALPAHAPLLLDVSTTVEIDELIRAAEQSRGDLETAQSRERSAEHMFDAADAEANIPTFELRATYMQMPSARAGAGLMFAMSLPWLWGGSSERRDSADYEREAARADVIDLRRTLRAQVIRASGQLRALKRSLTLLEEREIPAAERALASERALLSAGAFNLVAWIQAAHAVREAHVDKARIRGAIERAWIDLESAVGRPIRRRS